MKVHQLKTLADYFDSMASGKKPFEIRKNDRCFGVGDVLLLQEIKPTDDPDSYTYTGRMKAAEVTYITNYQQKPGYVVMGIKLV